jgi:RNA polymerase sigma factor (sigma-70 family)
VVVDRPLDEAELVSRPGTATSRPGDARAHIRASPSAPRTCSLATPLTPRLRGTDSSRRSARSGARRGAALRPWPRIVANEARNRRRSAGRRERLVLLAAAESRPGDAVPSPEAALVAREDQERLLAAVERLPDGHRDAIACRYFLELSEEETAAALGVRRGTVKSRLARALARLREDLEEDT